MADDSCVLCNKKSIAWQSINSGHLCYDCSCYKDMRIYEKDTLYPWIDVDSQLPNTTEYVLTFSSKDCPPIQTNVFLAATNAWLINTGNKITHWQPMPSIEGLE